MDTEYCQRCLSDKLVEAIGYIPLPGISDSRPDERRIFLCTHHYFQAKYDCYYVVPFDRMIDPVDSFGSQVNAKHRRIRGSLALKFEPRKSHIQERSKSKLPHSINQSSRNNNHKLHFCEGKQVITVCGLPKASTKCTNVVFELTCKNCLSLLDRKAASEKLLSV